MKKILKYLLVIILFIPLFVEAQKLDNIKLRWTKEFASYYRAQYEQEDSIILVTDDSLYQINKASGEVKRKSFSTEIYGVIKFKDTYIVLTSQYETDEIYLTKIYQFDKDLNVLNEINYRDDDHIYEIHIYGDEVIINSYYNYYYLTSDFKLVRCLQNSDGSYLKKESSSEYVLYDKNHNEIKTLNYQQLVKYKEGYLGLKDTNYISSPYSYEYLLDFCDEKFENCTEKKVNANHSNYTLINILEKVYFNDYNEYYLLNEDYTLAPIINPANSPEEEEKDLKTMYISEEIYENIRNKGYSLYNGSFKQDNKGNYIISGLARNHNDESQWYYYLGYYDSEGNKIFDKYLYETIIDRNIDCYINLNAVATDDYIVFAYNTSEKNFIEFYDLNGNLIKKEEIDLYRSSGVEELTKTKNGILLIASYGNEYCPSSATPQTLTPTFLNSKTPTLMDRYVETTVMYYEFPFEVKTKTDGNGTISSTHTIADSGENVEFEINPKEGYKLDKVVVIDENGNKLTFNDYKFTMPSSNVTIEATFIVDNPNTSASIYISISTLLLIIGLLIIKKYKSKIDFINN